MLIDHDLLAQHDVLVHSDNEFRRAARLRQSLWRERTGLPIGIHRGRPLGSRLAMPYAEQTLANFVTQGIRTVVRRELTKSEKLYKVPRIFNDLLSSQPLCFNLFGELALDLDLASRVFSHLLGKVVSVTAVEFEHSPGRHHPRFTDDGSAFDVFVTYETEGHAAFVGIEVKYVEDLNVQEALHRPRYDEVAREAGIFSPNALPSLRTRPLEQLWRDHLLACSLLADAGSHFEHGMFVVLYPGENTIVSSAVEKYRTCLLDSSTFTTWTLEHTLDLIDLSAAGSWAREIRVRYLGS